MRGPTAAAPAWLVTFAETSAARALELRCKLSRVRVVIMHTCGYAHVGYGRYREGMCLMVPCTVMVEHAPGSRVVFNAQVDDSRREE